MNRITIALIIFALSHVAFFAALGFTFHQLPHHVATHFNAAGAPDGWMTRSDHLRFTAGLALGISLFVIGIFYGVRFFPVATIKLPHRDHWLAPERRRETFDDIFQAGVWFASLEVLFMLGVHLLVVAANSSPPARLSGGIWVLGALFAGSVGLSMLLLIRRFSKIR